MTDIIFARHPDNKGDVQQQQHATFVHVIGYFLHSGIDILQYTMAAGHNKCTAQFLLRSYKHRYTSGQRGPSIVATLCL